MTGPLTHPPKGRFEELLVDSHIAQATNRVESLLTTALGVLHVPLRDDLLRDIANAVSILEANPEHKMIYGQALVTQGPMDGFRVYVPAADIFRIRLDTYFRDAMERNA